MQRRSFIAALGVAPLAGCAAVPGLGPSDTDGDGVPDDQDYAPRDPEVQEKADIPTPTESPTPSPTPTRSPTPVPTPTPFPFRQVNPWFQPDTNEFAADYGTSGGGRLAPGEFGALSWQFDDPFTLSYAFAVREGGPIDVLLLGQQGYDSFRESGSAGIIPGGSVLNAQRGETEVRLQGRTYYLVFDNSHAAQTRPSGDVEFVYGARTG